MELLKLSTDWAKAEVFSTFFFIFFASLFLIASVGFWQMGKTDLARGYIVPTLVAGLLIMIVGVGLLYSNKTRITQFEKAYKTDAASFYQSEIERSENTVKGYKTVFKVIPIIIILASLLIIFVNTPIWRPIGITTIAMLVVILLVDATSNSRMEKYHEELKSLDISSEIRK